MKLRNWAVLLLCAGAGQAQTTPGLLLQTGYSRSGNPIRVAPSQVLVLPVLGLELSSSEPRIVREPGTNFYPLEADGVRVVVRGASGNEWQANIVKLARQSCAQTAGGCMPVSAVTAILPAELHALTGAEENGATLLVFRNNMQIAAAPLRVVSDQLRIINSCDQTGVSISLFSDLAPSQCAVAVTHVNGSRITAQNPAVAGETVVIWVFGAGAANAAGSRADRLHYTPFIAAHYGTNAVPVTGAYANAGAVPAISAVPFGPFGHTQINVILPQPPAGITVPACNDASGIRSNMTLAVTGMTSMDGTGICVRP